MAPAGPGPLRFLEPRLVLFLLVVHACLFVADVLLDPLTDKILVSAPLIALVADGRLPAWAVWLLLARDLLISAWRTGQSTGAPASASGKAKTMVQFLALLLLLWPASWGPPGWVAALRDLGWWLFWPSLLLALSSAGAYLINPSAPDRR
ncbi:MAG: CDP-alcohol phosphatidyltransferase family protein [Prochlorococcaceae cyanobacterium]